MSKKTIYNMLRGIFYSFLMFFIVDCATSNIKDTDRLESDKGILVTNIHTNNSGYNIQIINKKSLLLSSANFKIDSNDNFILTSLPGGEYYWRQLTIWKNIFSQPSAIEFGDEMDFVIEAGKINYVGDLNILLNLEGSDLQSFDIDILDSTDVVLEKLQKEYPILTKSYPFVKHLTNKIID